MNFENLEIVLSKSTNAKRCLEECGLAEDQVLELVKKPFADQAEKMQGNKALAHLVLILNAEIYAK